MSQAPRAWKVRLTWAAEADLRHIVRWSALHFGEAQARRYAATVSDALTALSKGPTAIGATRRDDIAKGIFTLHVARRRRKGRHFVLFRVESSAGSGVIEILRILHDAMDPQRHLPDDDASE